MVRAKSEYDWQHTSALAAITLNVWKKRPVSLDFLNPHRRPARRRYEPVDIVDAKESVRILSHVLAGPGAAVQRVKAVPKPSAPQGQKGGD